MRTVKARKQGNAIMVTIPSTLEVAMGEEFYVLQKKNGTLLFIPKVQNHFDQTEEGEFDTPDLNWAYEEPKGREWE
ncbi:type II toxin-antitoxin system PemI/MazE family antitoxin [Listeria aquatica]|uniref:type II toxin-antitoxin system PemI/MazE family antitoxin n=1 Tax=Listeria aquatica TaxID=1494960 RepID=UPI003EF7C314